MTTGSQRHARRYAVMIIVATAFVYSNTFQAPFFFDDTVNIVNNPSIRGIPSVLHALTPPDGMGIAGRPLINFTLAVNYRISGLAPWSYHLFNLLIHIGSAIALFGVLRRTFLSDVFPKRLRNQSVAAAFAISLIWALHPLQTQAVTYTIQRCESLMGLFFLLIFYCALRGWQAKRQTAWHLASVLALFAGVGSKEVIVAAPILLFYYDILFVNGSPRMAIKRSPILYAGMISGTVALGFIVLSGGTMSSVAKEQVYSAFDYWRTQPEVLLHYIRLTFWPSALSISYDWPAARWSDVWPAWLFFTALLIASVSAMLKRNPFGFLSAWFYLILAPTLLIPLPDFAFEHRMYLPLVSLTVLAVMLAGRVDSIARIRRPHALNVSAFQGPSRWQWCFLALVGISLGGLTFNRNADYRDRISIWKDATQKRPDNSGALANLGAALMEKSQNGAALAAFTEALRIEMKNARRYSATRPGHKDKEALYHRYLTIRPVYATAENNIGLLLLNQGKATAALKHLQAALSVKPNHANALSNTGIAFIMLGRIPEAVRAFENAIVSDPQFIDAYVNLGVLLRTHGQPLEALKYFKHALHLMPGNVNARYGLTMTLNQLNQKNEAKLDRRAGPDVVPAPEILEPVRTVETPARKN